MKVALIIGLAMLHVTTASAQVPCPTPPNQVIVKVVSSVSRSGSGYAYSYRVANAAKSRQAINRLIVTADGTPSRVNSPAGWSSLEGNVGVKQTLGWYASDLAVENGVLDPDAPSPANI